MGHCGMDLVKEASFRKSHSIDVITREAFQDRLGCASLGLRWSSAVFEWMDGRISHKTQAKLLTITAGSTPGAWLIILLWRWYRRNVKDGRWADHLSPYLPIQDSMENYRKMVKRLRGRCELSKRFCCLLRQQFHLLYYRNFLRVCGWSVPAIVAYF